MILHPPPPNHHHPPPLSWDSPKRALLEARFGLMQPSTVKSSCEFSHCPYFAQVSHFSYTSPYYLYLQRYEYAKYARTAAPDSSVAVLRVVAHLER